MYILLRIDAITVLPAPDCEQAIKLPVPQRIYGDTQKIRSLFSCEINTRMFLTVQTGKYLPGNSNGFLCIFPLLIHLLDIVTGQYGSFFIISCGRNLYDIYCLLSESVLKHLYPKGRTRQLELLYVELSKNSVSIW